VAFAVVAGRSTLLHMLAVVVGAIAPAPRAARLDILDAIHSE
jgi:hypothetical protein